MKFSFSFKSIPQLFKTHIHYLLWIFLAVVIAMEMLIVKAAVDMVLLARSPAPGVQSKIIRVDFAQYELIEKRLNASAQYEPETVNYPSPFGTTNIAP